MLARVSPPKNPLALREIRALLPLSLEGKYTAAALRGRRFYNMTLGTAIIIAAIILMSPFILAIAVMLITLIVSIVGNIVLWIYDLLP